MLCLVSFPSCLPKAALWDPSHHACWPCAAPVFSADDHCLELLVTVPLIAPCSLSVGSGGEVVGGSWHSLYGSALLVSALPGPKALRGKTFFNEELK